MSTTLPLTVKHVIAFGHMSKEKVVKGIEQTWCRASKSARGDGKFAANAATPLQYASAGDSPPTTLLNFNLGCEEKSHTKKFGELGALNNSADSFGEMGACHSER